MSFARSVPESWSRFGRRWRAEVRVWLLNNGSIVIEHTQLMWNVPGPQVRIPVYSVLVEHEGGLTLFDTGIDLDHMNRVLPFELPEQTPEQTIPAQLELCGYGLGDVTTIVNSHLHIDHVGGNQLFEGTGVRNVIHEREVAQARNHEPFELFGYSDKSWDYEGANIETVSGDLELAPGVWLYETPGHTVGHYSYLFLGEKPMLFAVDVSYTTAAFEKGRLGMKTGGGIYDYTPEQIDQLRAARAGKLVAVRKALEG